MKHIRLVSDLHLDFDIKAFRGIQTTTSCEGLEYLKQEGDMAMLWYPPLMIGDDETTLVIAGDLWHDRKFLLRKYTNGESWLKRISRRFKYVVFVLGNHDYWGTNLTLERDSINKELVIQEITNTHLLEVDSVILDQVKFIGGTLWTDYDKENPHVKLMAPMAMANDHNYIKVGREYLRLRVEHLISIFNCTKKFIFKNCKKDNADQLVIVVTHMAPSIRSIHELYKTLTTNAFYYSNLDTELCYVDHDISYWFHGHTHKPMDYKIEESYGIKTRVLCNPRGYRGYEQTDFLEEFRIDV